MTSSSYTTTIDSFTWTPGVIDVTQVDVETLRAFMDNYSQSTNTRTRMSSSKDVGIVLAEIINGDK